MGHLKTPASFALATVVLAGCSNSSLRGVLASTCLTAGPAAERALMDASTLMQDTSLAALALRRKLGLSNLAAAPTLVHEEDLCGRSGRMFIGPGNTTPPRSVVLLRLGPVYVARPDTLPFPIYYIGQRLPFGKQFEVIEVLTTPD